MKPTPILPQRTPAAMARRSRTYTRTRSAQAGVSLVEALVAFLVTAFGMLSVAGMQATLSRNSDTAKQRSEAVRLAQQKMEQLRSFEAITGGNHSYGVDVVSNATEPGIAPAASNTTFTRTWQVTRDDGATATTSNDSRKWIHVTVNWADRQGATQPTPVMLQSVIARNDPVMLKGLVAGQVRPTVRYPKNRSLNIPYPAVTTSDPKRSAFIPPPGNVTFVFDNLTGKIVKSEPAPLYQLTSSNARWIGADLDEVELYLELSSHPDSIEVGGLLTTRPAQGPWRDVVVISPVSVPRKSGKSAPPEVVDAGITDSVAEPMDAAGSDSTKP